MSEELKELGVIRDANGRFVKGPGRKKGSKNRKTLVAHAIMNEKIEEIFNAYLSLAESDDKVVAERVFRFLLNKYTDSTVELAAAETMTAETRDEKLARIKELQGDTNNV